MTANKPYWRASPTTKIRFLKDVAHVAIL